MLDFGDIAKVDYWIGCQFRGAKCEAWDRIKTALVEGQKTPTNTQMPSASQIAAGMDMASTKVHGVVIIDLMMWNACLRQLRHL